MVAEIEAVSLRTTLVLMVLFMLLGTFAIFDPLRRAEKAEDKKSREDHVVWLKDKKLEGIKIQGKHGPADLTCAIPEGCPFDSTGEWKIRQPLEGRADSGTVSTLASTILNLRQSEKLEFGATPPDQKEFGFDQPRAELTLSFRGEKDPLHMKFGKATAVGNSVYLSVSSAPGTVFLVPSYVPDMVNKETFHWQNKRIFPEAVGNNFSRLGWSAGKTEIRALKLVGQWRLDSPVSAAASHLMIEGLASTVAYASAKSVYSPSRTTNEAKALFKGKPEMELLFGTEDGKAHQLKLYAIPGSKAKDMVAVVDQEPMLLLVDGGAFDRFRKPLLEYRQRSLIDEKTRAAATELRFTFPRDKQETIFRLEGADWKYASGAKPADAISQTRIKAFLNSLRDSDFKAFHPAKGASAEAKAFRGSQPELYLELKSGETMLFAAKFLVHGRGATLTAVESDVAVLGPEFLSLLPVRLGDLYESANKQLTVTDEPEKGAEDGHPYHPTDDGHDHSAH